jgi:hypothetical protein
MTLIRLTNTSLNFCKLRLSDQVVYLLRVAVSGLQISVAMFSHHPQPIWLVGTQLIISAFLNTVDTVYDIYLNPNNKVKRVFALSTRGSSSMGNTYSRKSNVIMNAMSSKSVNLNERNLHMTNMNNPNRRPSRPWAATNLVRVRSEKSDGNAKPGNGPGRNVHSNRIVPIDSTNSNAIAGPGPGHGSAVNHSTNSVNSVNNPVPSNRSVGSNYSVPGQHPTVYQAPRLNNVSVSINRRNSRNSVGSDNDPSQSYNNANGNMNVHTMSGRSANSSYYNGSGHNILNNNGNGPMFTLVNSNVRASNSNNSSHNNIVNNGGLSMSSANNSTRTKSAGANDSGQNLNTHLVTLQNNASGASILDRSGSNHNNMSAHGSFNYTSYTNASGGSNAGNARGLWGRANSKDSVSMSISRGLESMYNTVKNATSRAGSRVQSEASDNGDNRDRVNDFTYTNNNTETASEMGEMTDMLVNKTLVFDGFMYRFVDVDPFDIENAVIGEDLEDSAEYLANYTADLVGEPVVSSQHNSANHSYSFANNNNNNNANNVGGGVGYVNSIASPGKDADAFHHQASETKVATSGPEDSQHEADNMVGTFRPQ